MIDDGTGGESTDRKGVVDMTESGSAVAAYDARADEYTDQLGSMDAVAEPDRHLVERWAGAITGTIIDAGSGPGHWAAHLAALGHEVTGLEPSARFVALARERFPAVEFERGSFQNLRPGSAAGILAWYSLIHLDPVELPGALAGIHAALAHRGSLLIGFFEGPVREPFAHAIAPASFWPHAEMTAVLESAGFSVVEVHQRQDPGARTHGAIWAERSEREA